MTGQVFLRGLPWEQGSRKHKNNKCAHAHSTFELLDIDIKTAIEKKFIEIATLMALPTATNVLSHVLPYRT